MSGHYKPPAFVQVDVDGLWAIRRCYAQPEARSFRIDPVWGQGLPEFQRLFDELQIRAGFFLVGRDLMLKEKRERARLIDGDGHEIGNHSFTHRIGLTRLPIGWIMHEIGRTAELMLESGLPQPVGFRSPGYDVDARVLRCVRRLGYLYDASLLPTRVAPLLRLADVVMARRWQPRKRQFGRIGYAKAPRMPYWPEHHRIRKRARSFSQSGLLEIPVGTLPPFSVPLTASAIFSFGPEKVIAKLRKGLPLRRPLLLLLHGIDLVDCDKPIVFPERTVGLGGFAMTADEKRRHIEPVLSFLKSHYNIIRARDWAQLLIEGKVPLP